MAKNIQDTVAEPTFTESYFRSQLVNNLLKKCIHWIQETKGCVFKH